jgi:hypothetical protein
MKSVGKNLGGWEEKGGENFLGILDAAERA